MKSGHSGAILIAICPVQKGEGDVTAVTCEVQIPWSGAAACPAATVLNAVLEREECGSPGKHGGAVLGKK